MRVTGEIDLMSAPSLVDAVLKATNAELDLSGVTFMDSTGLNALITLRHQREALRIVAVSPPVQRLLEITDTSDLVLGVPTSP